MSLKAETEHSSGFGANYEFEVQPEEPSNKSMSEASFESVSNCDSGDTPEDSTESDAVYVSSFETEDRSMSETNFDFEAEPQAMPERASESQLEFRAYHDADDECQPESQQQRCMYL